MYVVWVNSSLVIYAYQIDFWKKKISCKQRIEWVNTWYWISVRFCCGVQATEIASCTSCVAFPCEIEWACSCPFWRMTNSLLHHSVEFVFCKTKPAGWKTTRSASSWGTFGYCTMKNPCLDGILNADIFQILGNSWKMSGYGRVLFSTRRLWNFVLLLSVPSEVRCVVPSIMRFLVRSTQR